MKGVMHCAARVSAIFYKEKTWRNNNKRERRTGCRVASAHAMLPARSGTDARSNSRTETLPAPSVALAAKGANCQSGAAYGCAQRRAEAPHAREPRR